MPPPVIRCLGFFLSSLFDECTCVLLPGVFDRSVLRSAAEDMLIKDNSGDRSGALLDIQPRYMRLIFIYALPR